MKQYRGVATFSFLYFALMIGAIICLIGWVINLAKLFSFAQMHALLDMGFLEALQTIGIVEVLRVIGVFAVPFGAFMGFVV